MKFVCYFNIEMGLVQVVRISIEFSRCRYSWITRCMFSGTKERDYATLSSCWKTFFTWPNNLSVNSWLWRWVT